MGTLLNWSEIHSSTFNKWTRCYGKAYEHNAKIPRDHWLTDAEKQAIIQFHFDHPLNGYSRQIVHWDIRPEMKEIDIEAILQLAKERYPEARPRIISDNGPQFIANDFKSFKLARHVPATEQSSET